MNTDCFDDAGPDPNFHFDADLDSNLSFLILTIRFFYLIHSSAGLHCFIFLAAL
jgi:hypothetical protein